MHDVMQHDAIQGQGQGQGHEPLEVGNSTIFQRYLLSYLQWGLANDHGFVNYGIIPKDYRCRIFLFLC